MKIVRETEKAKLIELEDGRQFWVQARWLRADGTLTPAGEKAKAEAKTPAQQKEDFLAKKEAEKSMTLNFKMIAETEKAIQVKFHVWALPVEDFEHKTWIPRSLIEKIDGNMITLPTWLMEKKKTEVRNRIPAIQKWATIDWTMGNICDSYQ